MTKETYNNPKSLKEANDLLLNQINGLAVAIENSIVPEYQEALSKILEEKRSLRKYINSRKPWNFNFKSGGWNSTVAVTKQEAIENSIKEYEESLSDIDEYTFRVATSEDTKQLLSLFY